MSNYRRLFASVFFALVLNGSLLWLPPSLASAQRMGGHTVYGDFKVDESKAGGNGPRAYQVLLYNVIGNVINRQVVTNNGRFRFFDVVNGDYTIVVEFEGAEVARLPLRLSYPQATDVRQDISLEWKADSVPPRNGKSVPSAALLVYERPVENQQTFQLAENAASKKDYAESATLLSQVVERDPKDYEAWIELGNAYFNLGKLKEAEKAFLRAVDAKPAFVLSYLNLGKIRIAGNNYQGAVDALNEAVKLQPTNAEANYFLGEAYLQNKKGSKAVGYLYEALKLEPIKMAEAHLRLATLYNGAGLKDKAAAEYEKFLKKKPDYPDRKKMEKYIAENKKQ